jgi:hypothetical protein
MPFDHISVGVAMPIGHAALGIGLYVDLGDIISSPHRTRALPLTHRQDTHDV